MKIPQGITLRWLGHASVSAEYDGKVVAIDPWITNNPKTPPHLRSFHRLDTILLTHAHTDHMGDVIPFAKQHHSTVVAIVELATWLHRNGVQNTIAMNKGGTVHVNGLKVKMTHAQHSNGIEDHGTFLYGGEPVGFVVEFPNGFKIYHAGDTNVFSDMAIIGELYKPDLALLPIGDYYTMDPVEAAYAIRLLKVRAVLPIHYGTFPVLTGTPEKLRELTRDLDVEIIELEPGDVLG